MRYKSNIMSRLEQLESSIQRLQLDVNRGVNVDNSVEDIKRQIEETKSLLSLESEDFNA